jgi:hypothetical protein
MNQKGQLWAWPVIAKEQQRNRERNIKNNKVKK